MKTVTDSVDSALLVALQEGLPLDTRPFARLGADLGLSEEAVLARVRTWFETGVARRFGAVFESKSLGYESTLCAADVPAGELEAAVARIVPHPGITHCYEREGHPNLWFTLTAPAQELNQELKRVAAALGEYEVLNLPALRRFKIEAVFGRREDGRHATPSPVSTAPSPAAPFTEREHQVVRRLQADLPLATDPFGRLAGELGYAPADLLELLNRWKQTGVIRRIGLVVRHDRLGFSANSLCVWFVTADRIAAAGAAVARSPHVTHCYERPAAAAHPFNLYAMIHAKTRAEAVGLFERLGADTGLSGGRMLWSRREFKKSSPVFFHEPPAGGG